MSSVCSLWSHSAPLWSVTQSVWIMTPPTSPPFILSVCKTTFSTTSLWLVCSMLPNDPWLICRWRRWRLNIIDTLRPDMFIKWFMCKFHSSTTYREYTTRIQCVCVCWTNVFSTGVFIKSSIASDPNTVHVALFVFILLFPCPYISILRATSRLIHVSACKYCTLFLC